MKKVLVGGCFDVFHYGHLYFLKQAKSKGDHLTIILESDKNVRKLKGPRRPIHNQDQRKELLESLNFVDEVIILKDEMKDNDYIEIIKEIKPNVIAITKGSKTKTHADLVGAKVVEIDFITGLSTTEILKDF